MQMSSRSAWIVCPSRKLSPFVKNLAKPLLFTNRPEWEGGSFKGSEAARIDLLLQAVQHDCALVDLELKTAPELRGELLDVSAAAPANRSYHLMA